MSNKWFRVIDPLNPLYGCDVDGYVEDKAFGNGRDGLIVTALRRVDVFIGDRPFQLVAKEHEDLGLMVDLDSLRDSPLQDDVVELTTDRPFGLCIDDSKMERNDSISLHVVRYERATQIALLRDGSKLASKTNAGDDRTVWENTVINLFSDGAEADDLTYLLRRD